MRRTLAAVAMVTLVVLAGCAALGGGGGSDGDDGSLATPATAETTDGPATDGGDGTGGEAGTDDPAATTTTGDGTGSDHPFVTDGRLNPARLVLGFSQTYRNADNLTVATNATIRTGDGEQRLAVRYQVRRLAFGSTRGTVEVLEAGESGQTRQITYLNASHACVLTQTGDEGLRRSCEASGVDASALQSLVVRGTPVEVLDAPAFEPAGTVTRDGRVLYQYNASRFTANLSSTARQKLGANATLVRGRLLATEDGRIVRMELTYRRDGGNGSRRLVERVYRTWAYDGTNVSRPSWLSGG